MTYFGVMFILMELSIATLISFYWSSTQSASPVTIATISSILAGKRATRNALAKNIQGQLAQSTLDVGEALPQQQGGNGQNNSNAPNLLVIDKRDLQDENFLDDDARQKVNALPTCDLRLE